MKLTKEQIKELYTAILNKSVIKFGDWELNYSAYCGSVLMRKEIAFLTIKGDIIGRCASINNNSRFFTANEMREIIEVSNQMLGRFGYGSPLKYLGGATGDVEIKFPNGKNEVVKDNDNVGFYLMDWEDHAMRTNFVKLVKCYAEGMTVEVSKTACHGLVFRVNGKLFKKDKQDTYTVVSCYPQDNSVMNFHLSEIKSYKADIARVLIELQ